MDFFGHWGEISIAPDFSGVYDIPSQDDNTGELVEQEKDETSNAGNLNNKEVEL